MSEWKEYKLNEIALITDCEHKTAPLVESSDFVSVRTSNITNGKIDFDNCNRVSKETYEVWTQRMIPKEGDIILAREAPVGEVGLIPSGRKVCLGQRTVLIRINNTSVTSKFLLYYLVNRETKFELVSRSTGSVVEHLNVKDIREFEIKIPESLSEQTAIAEVLSSLDDKIDLLHCQNKTLEQLAETLFRQWFVEEAEESWEEISFGNMVTPRKGKNLTKSEAIEGEFPVVAGGLEPSCYHNESNTKVPVITVSASGANAGFVRLYHIPVWSSDSSYIDETITPYVYFSYVFLRVNQRQLTDKQEGSAQPHVYPSHIMELDCLDYPKELIEKFEKEVTPLFQKIKFNTHQIRTLTQLRDTLLPKLMNGEIRLDLQQY